MALSCLQKQKVTVATPLDPYWPHLQCYHSIFISHQNDETSYSLIHFIKFCAFSFIFFLPKFCFSSLWGCDFYILLVHLPWVLNGNVSSFPVRKCFNNPNPFFLIIFFSSRRLHYSNENRPNKTCRTHH